MSILNTIRALLTSGKGIAVGLPDADSMSDPLKLFDAWFEGAKKSGILLPESMMLATATNDGKPSSRMVLLKSFDDQGFVFFTNYGSQKASELDANPFASLLFYWPILQRQVRIEGKVERVSREESSAYFRTRSRGSQIGAWASDQSAELESRETLESRSKDLRSNYEGREIPLPGFWGGYRLSPSKIEFWQGRPFRLHDRIVFEQSDGSWKTSRLYP